jgi:hypothetical protein
MNCFRAGNRLAFNGGAEALHCFFYFRQFGHSPSIRQEKRHLRITHVLLPSSAMRPEFCATSVPT